MSDSSFSILENEELLALVINTKDNDKKNTRVHKKKEYIKCRNVLMVLLKTIIKLYIETLISSKSNTKKCDNEKERNFQI